MGGSVSMNAHTSNVISQMMESGTQDIVPVVGMGATINYHSDRRVGTIVEVGKDYIVVQDDDVKADLSKGPLEMGHQEWLITPNKQADKTTFTKRKNGRWVRQGESAKKGLGCSINVRDYYYDWSF